MSNRPYKWEEKNADHSYDDIINLSRPKSMKHSPMSIEARAAQFSPYDALTGYSDQIAETARITDGRVELSPEEQQTLDQKIAVLVEKIATAGRYGAKPNVTVIYFVPDKKKDGGQYDEIEGIVRLVDTVNRELVLVGEKSTDELKIKLDDIVEIYGEVFDALE